MTDWKQLYLRFRPFDRQGRSSGPRCSFSNASDADSADNLPQRSDGQIRYGIISMSSLKKFHLEKAWPKYFRCGLKPRSSCRRRYLLEEGDSEEASTDISPAAQWMSSYDSSCFFCLQGESSGSPLCWVVLSLRTCPAIHVPLSGETEQNTLFAESSLISHENRTVIMLI